MPESKNHKPLFTAGGCCTEDALLKLGSGSLDKEQAAGVESHLEECELCREAAEGITRYLLLNNPGAFSTAVGTINHKVAARARDLQGNGLNRSGKPGSGRFWIFFAGIMVLWEGVFNLCGGN